MPAIGAGEGDAGAVCVIVPAGATTRGLLSSSHTGRDKTTIVTRMAARRRARRRA
jgi:hypothetical protein